MSVLVADSVPVSAEVTRVRQSGRLARRGERGMVSAEWAVGILAAIAIAGVLLAVVTDGQVQDALLQFILFVIRSFSTMASGG
jgi:Protein of unknown function (DUF4244)